MDPSTQIALSIGIPTLAVLAGILVNNSRLGDMNSRLGDMNSRFSDLRAHMDARFNAVDVRFNGIDTRFDDMKETWRSELHRVEEVLDARLKHLEER
jgi:hypothetical protein